LRKVLQKKEIIKKTRRCRKMKKHIDRIDRIRKNANIQSNFDRLMELNSLKVYDMINRF